LSRGNPEVECVLDRKIPYRSLPQTLEDYFLPGHDSLVITGTHGKTTTTSMLHGFWRTLAATLISYRCVAENFGPELGLGGGTNLYLEATNMTPPSSTKPRNFCTTPDEAIITSLEFDHAGHLRGSCRY